MQQFVDSINKITKDTRSSYHITLGQLIDGLKKYGPDTTVQFINGAYPGSPHSYRGHYSDLALEPNEQPIKVPQLIDQLEKVLNTELTGYKGGEFLMDTDVPMWCAEYGNCGKAIVGVEEIDSMATLITKNID